MKSPLRSNSFELQIKFRCQRNAASIVPSTKIMALRRYVSREVQALVTIILESSRLSWTQTSCRE